MIITETKPLEFADEALGIPEIALDLGNFSGDESHQLHVHEDVLILLKRDMTALEVVHAIEGVSQVTTSLLLRLLRACGKCDGDEENCPVELACVPEDLVKLLADCGVCLARLEHLLSTHEVIG